MSKKNNRPPADLKVQAWIAQNQGERKEQQDCADIFPKEALTKPVSMTGQGVLAMLCDGMGGMRDGRLFAETGIAKMTETFQECGLETDERETLLKCFGNAEDATLALQEDGKLDGGATALMALFRNGRCTTLSCGDSTTVLVRKGGLIRLNREQNLGRVLVERAALGVIDWEDAIHNRESSALTCYLGAKKKDLPSETEDAIGRLRRELNRASKEKTDAERLKLLRMADMDAAPFRVVSGDCVAVMSDGVSGVLTDDNELAKLLLDRENPAEKVIRAVLNKKNPYQDNCTIVVIHIL